MKSLILLCFFYILTIFKVSSNSNNENLIDMQVKFILKLKEIIEMQEEILETAER